MKLRSKRTVLLASKSPSSCSCQTLAVMVDDIYKIFNDKNSIDSIDNTFNNSDN
jgi:hypothetical protein